MTDQKPEEGIQLEELISLVESSVSDLKQFIRENDLSDDDLRRILKAEQSAKNRSTAVNYIKRQLESHQHSEIVEERTLGELKVIEDESGETRFVADIQGIKFDLENMPMLNLAGHRFEIAPDEGEHVENVSHVGNAPVPQNFSGAVRGSAVQQSRRAGASQTSNQRAPVQSEPVQQTASPPTGSNSSSSPNSGITQRPGTESQNSKPSGTRPQKDQTDNNEEDIDQAISDIIEGERQNLVDELKNKYGVEEDEINGKSVSDLKQLKSKLERKRAKKQELMDKFGVSEDRLEGKDIQELEGLESELEELESKRQEVLGKYNISEEQIDDKNLDELRDFEEKLEKRKQKREEIENKYDVEPERLQGKDIDELKEFAEKLDNRKKLAAELTTYGYKPEELKDKDLDDLHEMVDEIKQKKELMDELGVEMDDEKLSEITLAQLRNLKDEKNERQQLISELKEHGVNEEMLRKSSNEDLKKLKSEIESQKEQQEEKTDRSDDEEPTEEELKEEAEEDLEVLMGAVEEKEKEKDDDGSFMEYFDLKSEFSSKWEKLRGSDEEDENDKESKYEKVVGILESYRDLERRESAIKTAQVLKGYLEYLLEIDRELTYSELADSLEGLDNRDENVDTLIKFFRKMDESYRGEVRVNNVDEVIDTSEKVINDLR
ncbi:MAG: hypothetical protein ACI8Z7_000145 [Candidatus Nanohaloarchaea archaeon]|jgi:hypothetical protein